MVFFQAAVKKPDKTILYGRMDRLPDPPTPEHRPPTNTPELRLAVTSLARAAESVSHDDAPPSLRPTERRDRWDMTSEEKAQRDALLWHRIITVEEYPKSSLSNETDFTHPDPTVIIITGDRQLEILR